MKLLKQPEAFLLLEQKKSVGAFLLKSVLGFLSWLYFLAIKSRAFLYKVRIFRSGRLPCKVISVGNITTGGTGKTPLVEWIARWISQANGKVVILSHGYGKVKLKDRLAEDDESFTSEWKDEHIVRWAGRNRIALAQKAVRELECDVLILDDGFQHYRIKRDIDIVTLDSTHPFSNEHLIPRGLLREPPSSLHRAHMIVLTRVDQTDKGDSEQLKKRVEHFSGKKPLAESIHKPVQFYDFVAHATYPLEWIKNKAVYAFCGIGNPRALRRTLRQLGANVVRFRPFDDHHIYNALEIQQIVAEAQEFMVECLVTTEKDAHRLKGFRFALPLLILKVELDFVSGREMLENQLRTLFEELQKPKKLVVNTPR